MSTFDAVTDAVELMRVWSDEGAVAAQDRVSEITGGRREDLLVGLVNLLGSAHSVSGRRSEGFLRPGRWKH
jgi:hypothetical protein